jgi:hypothetical protein
VLAVLASQQQARLFMEMLVVPLYLMPYLLAHLRAVLLPLVVAVAVLVEFLLLKMVHQAAVDLGARVVTILAGLLYLDKVTLVVMVYPALSTVVEAEAAQGILGKVDQPILAVLEDQVLLPQLAER